MDPLKLNLFQGVGGAQPIAPMDDNAGKAPEPVEDKSPIEIDVTPDEEGVVDISNMTMDFEDKLKNFKQ